MLLKATTGRSQRLQMGYVRIQINSAQSIDINVAFYDVNGTTQFMGDGRSGTYSEVFGFLKPGTYYIYAYRQLGTTGSYTISNSFATPARAPDVEPNDSYTTAIALSPIGSSTGHIGFFGNGAIDHDDWWKITITEDGWLRVQVRSDSLDLRGDVALDINVAMYDVNGTTSIREDNRSGTFSEVAAFLRPGTYYVLAWRWVGRAGGYEIKSEFFTPPLANDAEGNDSWQTASTAIVNGTVTGHIGFYSSGTTDWQDYWKFTVPNNGRVVVQVTSDSVDRSGVLFDLNIEGYDVNGTRWIATDGRSGKFSECTLFLRPGTFYVHVWRWRGNAGSYSLRVTHTPPARANDVEGNDSPASATLLTYGATSTGHIGYYANNFTDTQDYWRLTAPSADSIYVHVTSDLELDLDMTIFASDGTTSIGSDGRSGVYSRVGIRPTSGATYYVLVYRWTGTAGSYSILATRSSLVSVKSPEPEAVLPTEFALLQNYPNPFNPATTIQFSLPTESDVRLTVFSLLGQSVRTLVDGKRPAGNYSLRWDGTDEYGLMLPSGIYLYRLETGEKTFVKRMVLIR